MELERLTAQIKHEILERVPVPEFHPGEFSLWIRFIRLGQEDGSTVEQTVAPAIQLNFQAGSAEEVAAAAAEEIVLAVFGAAIPVVSYMPNLIVRLFARKAVIPAAGAPPLDQPGQIFLKASVNTRDRGLWEALFGQHGG